MINPRQKRTQQRYLDDRSQQLRAVGIAGAGGQPSGSLGNPPKGPPGAPSYFQSGQQGGTGQGFWSYAGGYPAWVGYGAPEYVSRYKNTAITYDAAGYPVAYSTGNPFFTYGGLSYANGCYYVWPELSSGPNLDVGCLGAEAGGCGFGFGGF